MKNPSIASVGIYCCAAVFLSLLFTTPHAGLMPDTKEQTALPPESTAQPRDRKQESVPPPAFRIDQPGTITFTVGMVVKGKIDKPQVIIFLPKERTLYRELKLTHSFADRISEPLPFSPVLE